MRHPCMSNIVKGDFIPNDIVLGKQPDAGAEPTCILLTGPNMGGKSTLLRQACLAAIIAQVVREAHSSNTVLPCVCISMNSVSLLLLSMASASTVACRTVA